MKSSTLKHIQETIYKEVDKKFWKKVRKENELYKKKKGQEAPFFYSASTTSSSVGFSTASFNLAVNPSVATET